MTLSPRMTMSDLSKCRFCNFNFPPGHTNPRCPGCNMLISDVKIDPVVCKLCGNRFSESKDRVEKSNLTCKKCGTPYNGGGQAILCGCGRHYVPLSEESARYKNKWWSLKCLFFKVDKRLPRLIEKFDKLEAEIKFYKKMRTKFTKMKNYLKRQPCSNCGHPAGNRFSQWDDAIFCGKCSRNFNQE